MRCRDSRGGSACCWGCLGTRTAVEESGYWQEVVSGSRLGWSGILQWEVWVGPGRPCTRTHGDRPEADCPVRGTVELDYHLD